MGDLAARTRPYRHICASRQAEAIRQILPVMRYLILANRYGGAIRMPDLARTVWRLDRGETTRIMCGSGTPARRSDATKGPVRSDR